ncbi:MAG: RNA polymerase sigma factor [Deltaproteobacteria bacterium]|nr:RNA polymerase sigma factor [Deltaproteobacteria bacterium]
MDKSDNHIIKQVRQGDTESYSKLVKRYQKAIYNLMYRISQSNDDAAELTQDVFCKAFEKLAYFKDGQRFFPWLYTLAANHGKDWIRGQARKRDGLQVYSEGLIQENSSHLSNGIEKRQEIRRMLGALADLPHEKREMLILRYKQELSVSELGEIFNLSTSAVKMRIHRSLGLLKKFLSENHDTNE